jgi:arylsulfatase A-like enzyme
MNHNVANLIEQLSKNGQDIDNLLIVFTTKDGPTAIKVGLTEDSSMTWVLSALEWVRWHQYDNMSRMAMARDMEAAVAEAARAYAEGTPDSDKGKVH